MKSNLMEMGKKVVYNGRVVLPKVKLSILNAGYFHKQIHGMW